MRDRVVNKTYCEELPQVTRNKRKRSDGSSLLARALASQAKGRGLNKC